MDLQLVWKLECVGLNPVALSGRFCEVFLLGAQSFESCVVCFKSFEDILHVALDFVRVLWTVSQCCVYCTTPCLEA